MDKSNYKQYAVVLIFVALIFGAKWYIVKEEDAANLPEKIYVAVEGDGKIAVVDPVKLNVANSIDLTVHGHGGPVTYQPHNVQVSPDGSAVWVTANAGSHDHSFRVIPKAFADTGHAEGENDDQIIVIDPNSDKIIKRIDIARGQHLAHVVLTPDGKYAYATAQTAGKIFKINAKTYEVEQALDVGSTEPHGLRTSTDGKSVYIAMLKGNSMGVLDAGNDNLKFIKLEGAAVQTAVSPDGKYAMASIYDKKSIAIYNTATQKLSYVRLPSESKGPVQLYPTPDSKYVYIADQGYYFSQPNSHYIYKLDLSSMKIVKTIAGGTAPHGVVVSKDGSRAYVTNLLSGDLSVIDTATDKIISTINLGKEPNGISIWSKDTGGTP
jgi:YVTN family beta-propeller protein